MSRSARRSALGSALLAAAALAGGASPSRADEVPPHTSVGDTHSGHLTDGGAELPLRGPGFHWASNRGNDNARFAVPALVGAIARAADRVRRDHPGSDLEIHDLSLPGGGPIRGHGSHRSGRDADIAYYARNADGSAMNPTQPIWFGARGRERGAPASRARRFDARRTWAFVHTLLRDRTIRVQYVFMHPRLQRRLLAAARGEAAALHAVLRTPRGRRMDPHADHMHVRIHCPRPDLAHGCADGRRRR